MDCWSTLPTCLWDRCFQLVEGQAEGEASESRLRETLQAYHLKNRMLFANHLDHIGAKEGAVVFHEIDRLAGTANDLAVFDGE